MSALLLLLRDVARMLSNEYKNRVMIVDTSNEIGGVDIPHAGIGNAHGLQVPHSDVQHKVLIEAVENHMPNHQVIVIDEIGTKLEALAASTIAQRGIQLIATAHGVTIKNLVMNPALEMLVGGVQTVGQGTYTARYQKQVWFKSKFKKNSRLQAAARTRGIPTYICKVVGKQKSASTLIGCLKCLVKY